MERKGPTMRLVASVWSVLVVTLAVVSASAAAEKKSPHKAGRAAVAATANSAQAEDEKAIRQVVEAFVHAYNAHDAKAAAALFTADGTLVDEANHTTKGREAIEEEFADVFDEYPEIRIQNVIESIHFAGPAKAIEKGWTTTTHDKDTPAEKNRYHAIHVKQNGKWLMASAADLPEDAWTGEDKLEQLEGFIGEWVDESPDALVLTSYQWTDNRRFILGTFTTQVDGQPATTGTHRIGWNPLKKTFHSWMFDSEGCYAEGDWTRHGDTWTVTLSGVTRDGKPTATTQTFTLVGKHRMAMQSVNRVVGDEKLPDGEKTLAVRRPPSAN